MRTASFPVKNRAWANTTTGVDPGRAWRKASSLVVLLVVLVSGFGISQHHHDDLREHDDCQVCVLGATVSTPPDLPAVPVVYFRMERLERIENLVLPTLSLGQIHQARAPPV